MNDSMEMVSRHIKLCNELNELYSRKNRDYGNSFHDTFEEEGLAMARVRLSDKLNRFKTLTFPHNVRKAVKDETLRDTLMDLANYAIMTIMEMDIYEENNPNGSSKELY